MKSGGGGTQTTTQTQAMPAWLDNYSQQTLNIADNVTSRPYQGYDGQRVQGFTGDQTTAQGAIRNQQGQTGAALGSLGQTAQGMAGYQPQQVGAGSLAGTDLQPYMSPYLAEVESNALTNINDQRVMAGNQIADRAITGGAYGGSRFALQQSANDAAAMQQAGQMSANLRQAGFQQAQQAAQGDIGRRMQADMFNSQQGLAGQQAALGALGMAGNFYQGQQGANYQDIGALAASGGEQQAMGQAGLDVGYQNWLAQQGHDMNMLNARAQIGMGVPHGSTTTSTQPVSGGNPAMGALGGAASGAAMGSAIKPGWGTAIGALGGGLLGAFGSRK